VQLVSAVRQGLSSAGFPDYPLLAGTATQSIDDTVTQLTEAQSAGAQWGMCLVPGYFANTVSQAGIATWFEAVADRSPIPILVYHYPGVSNNVALLPNTMQLLAAHPNIVGCKLSHGNLDDHALIASNPNINHERFHTFTGLGQQLVGVLSVGGAGAIDGLAAAFPRCVVRLYDLFRLQERHGGADPISTGKTIRALQYNVCQGEKLVVKWGTVGIREAVARVLHFGDSDGGRWPLRGGFPTGDAEWESWKFAVEPLQASELEFGTHPKNLTGQSP
jgi:2-keto-3-deoxy-L-rhamnonate aldolase